MACHSAPWHRTTGGSIIAGLFEQPQGLHCHRSFQFSVGGRLLCLQKGLGRIQARAAWQLMAIVVVVAAVAVACRFLLVACCSLLFVVVFIAVAIAVAVVVVVVALVVDFSLFNFNVILHIKLWIFVNHES